MIKVAYLVSHPIQYQAPVLATLAKNPLIDLHVYFCSEMGSTSFYDPEFKQEISWDIPILEGYSYEFLPAVGSTAKASAWLPLNYGLIRRLKKNGTQVLWVHGYARAFNFVSIFLAKLFGIKVILRDDATELSRERSSLKQFFKSSVFFFLQKAIDRVITVGTLNTTYFKNLGFPEEKLTTVPYAVDTDYFEKAANSATKNREELRNSLGLSSDKPVILYVGKLIDIKAPHHLLESFISLSEKENTKLEANLLFVGDGPLRESMEARAEQAGLGNVKFLGFKNQTELPRYYDLCDLLVLPSMHETWGLVVNEAMCAGKAVIVSDNVGCGRDLVRANENGYTFPAGDIGALCTKLELAIEDRAKLSEMGEKSREMVASFSLETTSNLFAEMLQQLERKESQ